MRGLSVGSHTLTFALALALALLAVGALGCPQQRARPGKLDRAGGSAGTGQGSGAATSSGPRQPLQLATGAGGDQLDPVLVATPSSWLVGWATDLGASSELRVSTAAALAKRRSLRLARGKHVGGLRLAAGGAGALACWSDGAAIWVRVLGADAKPRGPAITISGGPKAGGKDPVGRPGVVRLSGGKAPTFAVVWVSGARVRAAKLDAAGKVVARSWWHGGNIRPVRRRMGPKPRKPKPGVTAKAKAKVAAPPQRAKPLPVRPRLYVLGGKLHARWFGGRWLSDDLGGTATYEQQVRWKDDDKREPRPTTRRTAWDAPGPLAVDGQGKLAGLIAYHNPNGGPWQLRLWRQGESAKAAPFTSEAAGPLRSALVALGGGFVAAWQSPARQAVVIARLGGQGEPQLAAIPNEVAPGDARVVLARRGKELRVAYVSGADGPTRVVVAELSAAKPLASLSSSGSEQVSGHVIAKTRAIYDDAVIAPFAGGRFALVAKDQRGSPRLVAGWFDHSGMLMGKLSPISTSLPRIDFTAVAKLGQSALVAFTACNGPSICSPSKVQLAALGPKGVLAAGRAVVDRADQAALAVRREAKGKRYRVALLTKGDSWGHWSVRRVRATDAKRAVGALAAAKPSASIHFVDSNYGGAAAIAFTDRGLLMVHRDRENGRAVLRVVLVPDKGEPKLQRRLPAVDYAGWGASRIASYRGGVVLLGLRTRGRRVDTVLRFLSPDGAKVLRTVVLARGMAPTWPRVVVGEQGVVCSWYDRRTDGDYVALVDHRGRRRAGPLRLDDPTKRASFGGPLLAPAAKSGRWHALWPDRYTGHYALFHALVKLP